MVASQKKKHVNMPNTAEKSEDAGLFHTASLF